MKCKIDRKNRDRKGGHRNTSGYSPAQNKFIKREGVKKIRRQFNEAKEVANALYEISDEEKEYNNLHWEKYEEDYYNDNWDDLYPEPIEHIDCEDCWMINDVHYPWEFKY